MCDDELTGRYPPDGPYLCLTHSLEKAAAWNRLVSELPTTWAPAWIADARARRHAAALVKPWANLATGKVPMG